MTTLPAGGYFSDPTRKNQGAKQGLDAILAVLRELPGGRAAVVAEIQGGAIEPDTALVLLETEGQASADALDLIATTHHPEGRLLLLRPATSGRTITVRHAFQGDGAIHLRDETALEVPAENVRAWPRSPPQVTATTSPRARLTCCSPRPSAPSSPASSRAPR